MNKKVRIIEVFKEPKENNLFRVEEITPDGKIELLKIFTYDEEKQNDSPIWSREVNYLAAIEYAKKYEQFAHREDEIIYQTPD